MADPRRAHEVLDRLRALGVRLSLDDFGTGHSSLSYLKRLPLDEVKIDRAFVSGIVGDVNDLLIVRSTIDLARNLGLEVVAEGVEGEDVLDHLRALRCHEAQGFHLSRPLPADALVDWLAGWRRRRLSRSEAAPRAAAATRGNVPFWRRAATSAAVWRSGLSGTPSFAAVNPARPNSRWSELPVPSSATQRTRDARCPSAARATRRSKRRVARRAQPHRRGRGRPRRGESAQRRSSGAARADAADERARAQVVGLPGVDPLLRAGGDEPDVAARRERGDARGERDERADAGRVVLGAGRRRDRVGVRHQDPQAARRGGRARRSRCASGPCRGR